MEDLISIGTIGLIKAVETYKEDYGSRLATYAARCIDNELLMHFRAKKKTSKEVSLYEPIGTDKVYYHKPLRTLWEKDNDTEGDRKKTWDFQILCFEDRKEGDRKTQAGILGVL